MSPLVDDVIYPVCGPASAAADRSRASRPGSESKFGGTSLIASIVVPGHGCCIGSRSLIQMDALRIIPALIARGSNRGKHIYCRRVR